MRRDIKMDELRALVALIDCGSLARAAAVVGRTESALSLQLKRLEVSAGAVLFEKQGRKLVLTEAGRVVLEHGRRLIAAQQELRKLAIKIPETNSTAAATQSRPFSMDYPMRVTMSPEGQFREMRPLQSFRATLGGPLLVSAYDYWAARGQRGEALDFDVLAGLCRKHTVSHICAVIKLTEAGPRLCATSETLAEGATESVEIAKHKGSASPFTKITPLLMYVQRLATPISWTGVSVIARHRASCAHSLALPLSDPGGTCGAILFVSEISSTDRYIYPTHNDISSPPKSEQILISPEVNMPLPFLHPRATASKSRRKRPMLASAA